MKVGRARRILFLVTSYVKAVGETVRKIRRWSRGVVTTTCLGVVAPSPPCAVVGCIFYCPSHRRGGRERESLARVRHY
jgi:hypothetical protein